ncbi:hypothetical protein K8I31_00325, partial [bacterium]|nr:hypothetical protein [bacterium]
MNFEKGLRRNNQQVESRAARHNQIVVIGNGMVCAKFCESLIQGKKGREWKITVIGDELYPAYDRIH